MVSEGPDLMMLLVILVREIAGVGDRHRDDGRIRRPVPVDNRPSGGRGVPAGGRRRALRDRVGLPCNTPCCASRGGDAVRRSVPRARATDRGSAAWRASPVGSAPGTTAP